MEGYEALVAEWRALAKDMMDLAKEFGRDDFIHYEKFMQKALTYISKIDDNQKSITDAYDVVDICGMLSELYKYANNYERVMEYSITQQRYGEAIFAQTRDTGILLKVGNAYISICACYQQQGDKINTLACLKNGIRAIEPGCNQYQELAKLYQEWQQQINALELELAPPPAAPPIVSPTPASAVEGEKPMFCIMCGCKNKPGAKFCAYCGKKLQE